MIITVNVEQHSTSGGDLNSIAASRIAADLEVVLRTGVDRTLPSVVGVAPFGDGHSGFTYAVDISAGGETRRRVLRLSPPRARIAGPADVGRQGRIMEAINAAGAPAPRVLACDSRPCIDGRAFALMELVEGHGWEREAGDSSHDRVADAALEALAQIQALDVTATGLAGERPSSPPEDVARWAGLLERGSPALLTAGQTVARDLETSAPAPTSRPVLVHGDYHYGNLLFADRRVVAVVDWEIAQLGEPLLDFASLAVASLRRRYDPEPNPTGGVDLTLDELADRYGVPAREAAWFTALTCFKYAAILSYNAELHRRGKRPDPIYNHLAVTIPGLLDDAAAILAGGIGAARERAGAR